MSREIKFRIWHNGIMSFPHEGDCELYFDNVPWSEERFGFLMQFTGLKDKNGKEVCEGDILENIESTKEIIAKGFWEADDFERSVVTWDDELSRFVLHFHSKYGGEGYTGRDQHFDLYVKDGCTVIGNIHENPELLDPSKP